MANVMNLKNLKNKPSRNGFDLSEKNAFTAKAGELLPVMTKEVLPGDHFEIDLRNFTRTQPVQTAAYTNFREYYDFFFVPYSQLWHNWNAFSTNLGDEASQKATSITQNAQISDQAPFMSKVEMMNVLRLLGGVPNTEVENIYGFNRGVLAAKLLNYLDYGDYRTITEQHPSAAISVGDVALNPFPLLAYQKIYQDFYRNTQWEKPNPCTYNLDYMNSKNPASLSLNLEAYVGTELNDISYASNIKFEPDTIFDLRYANWEKDYFTGLLPNSQTGDVAIAAPLTGGQIFDLSKVGGTTINVEDGDMIRLDTTDTASQMGISALALRQAEFLQRWKEIAQSGSKDYKDQIYKHWGVKLSDDMSKLVRFLGGHVSDITINEVVNQTFTEANKATIKGKGIGVGQGHVSFDAKEHGLIMCIYHCVPLLEYSLDSVSKLNTKTKITDYAIPELDRLGMQPVFHDELVNTSLEDQVITTPQVLGYAPRYFDYKTAFDKVHGAFRASLESWVAPMNTEYLHEYLRNNKYKLDYRFFKVDPRLLDSIFGVFADSYDSSDTFLVNASFDVKVARNLDYDGMPY